MPNSDLQTALGLLKTRQDAYMLYRDYYNGNHRLAFATDKFTSTFGSLFAAFSDNLCPAVVDAVADRLTLKGFGIEEGVEEGEAADNIQVQIQTVWQRNRMDRRSGEAHLEALRQGDGYLIVWPDSEGQPVFYMNKGNQVVVMYDEELPGNILWAAKWWRQSDKLVRVNMYYPDRIEKYISTRKVEKGLPQKEAQMQPLPDAPRITNEYGTVPVFHLPNNATTGELGVSELKDVVPLQDALNKALADMLVAMEFHALPQRWITGFDVNVDQATGTISHPFKIGAGNIWITTPADAGNNGGEVKFGEFPAAGLQPFIAVQESFRAEIARVSGTPLHYLMLQSGNFPSGESMKTAEARFLAKVRDRGLAFGNTWEDAMTFALRILGIDGVRLSAQWEDPAPVSEKEKAERMLLHQQLEPVFLKKLGYSDEEVAAIVKDRRDLGSALIDSFTNDPGPTDVLSEQAAATPGGE